MSQNKEITQKDRSVLAGNERAVPYKVMPMPADKKRFAFTWEIFKQKLGKIIYINLMTLVCFTPLIATFIYCYLGVLSAGASGPFADFLGVGYPASPETAGLEESMIMSVIMRYFLIAIPLSAVAALGIAGGTYSTRKLLRTDDPFRIRDFFRGIKEGYVCSLIACVAIFAVLFAAACLWSYSAYAMATGASAVLWIVLRVLISVVLALVVLLGFWLIAVGSNYSMDGKGVVSHVFRFTFQTVLQSVVCLVIGVAPVILFFFGSLLALIAGVWYILFGFATVLLIWSSFTDWAFDLASDYTKGQIAVQEKAEAAKSGKTELSDEERMNMLRVGGRSAYLARAIEPFDNGTAYIPPVNFTAEDLQKAEESRKQLRKEADEYAALHEKEEKYTAYNQLFDDREKMISSDGKSKKKKFNPKMLNS
jgi:hypothetical protein